MAEEACLLLRPSLCRCPGWEEAWGGPQWLEGLLTPHPGTWPLVGLVARLPWEVALWVCQPPAAWPRAPCQDRGQAGREVMLLQTQEACPGRQWPVEVRAPAAPYGKPPWAGVPAVEALLVPEGPPAAMNPVCWAARGCWPEDPWERRRPLLALPPPGIFCGAAAAGQPPAGSAALGLPHGLAAGGIPSPQQSFAPPRRCTRGSRSRPQWPRCPHQFPSSPRAVQASPRTRSGTTHRTCRRPSLPARLRAAGGSSSIECLPPSAPTAAYPP
mmetsp:Transcript_4008/g.11313  ORF Transcript_4008/g.11313 Transcript_4008/m.11313 type:complete len:271 (+) Transcript_4008:608-1420(+)